jgi:hypothetical protein
VKAGLPTSPNLVSVQGSRSCPKLPTHYLFSVLLWNLNGDWNSSIPYSQAQSQPEVSLPYPFLADERNRSEGVSRSITFDCAIQHSNARLLPRTTRTTFADGRVTSTNKSEDVVKHRTNASILGYRASARPVRTPLARTQGYLGSSYDNTDRGKDCT